MEPCNKGKRRVCAKEEEGVFIVKRREERYVSLLRKRYIRPLKLLQTAPVFFVGEKDGKKHKTIGI